MTAPGYADCWEHLADELRRLDLLIGTRLGTADGPDGSSQLNRAMYVTRQEVEELLAAGPAEPASDRSELEEFTAHVGARVAAGAVALPLPELGRIFGLSALELDAVLICLAPEVRRKYDRLYAYLQDDITRQRPSVDLVLDLLCPTERERWAARAVFADDAPLSRFGILRPIEDPHSPSGSSGLGRFLVLDPQITRFLLGAARLDARLSG